MSVCRSKTSNAKLTTEDVVLIKQLLTEKEALETELKKVSTKAIAEKFEVSEGTIKRIATGECWWHVKGNKS